MTAPRRLGLASRTAIVLLLSLAAVQAAGLLIYALDRIELQWLVQAQEVGPRAAAAYRAVVADPPGEWVDVAAATDLGPDMRAEVAPDVPRHEWPPAEAEVERLLRPHLSFHGLPPPLRPSGVEVLGSPALERMLVALGLPDGRWLLLRARVPRPRPWHTLDFVLAFCAMTFTAAALSFWAVRRLTEPVRTLAAAAERLGRDVRSPPLPEGGSSEVAAAAAAFNTMAARIRRFVDDRTSLLAAIGHDLRTPITRMKLRVEWLADEELRRKMLADLDEMQAMVSATLAFGRDVAADEPAVPLDLAALLRTVLDEAADAAPELAGCLHYAGPEHAVVRGRPMALKRAVANLVSNAAAYGGGARVSLLPPADGAMRVLVEDDGPGIAPEQLERVFEPFYRLEGSRNRETGGTGLGLSIARNILRAHGGDVVLANRPEGGLRATAVLPV